MGLTVVLQKALVSDFRDIKYYNKNLLGVSIKKSLESEVDICLTSNIYYKAQEATTERKRKKRTGHWSIVTSNEV